MWKQRNKTALNCFLVDHLFWLEVNQSSSESLYNEILFLPIQSMLKVTRCTQVQPFIFTGKIVLWPVGTWPHWIWCYTISKRRQKLTSHILWEHKSIKRFHKHCHWIVDGMKTGEINLNVLLQSPVCCVFSLVALYCFFLTILKVVRTRHCSR